MGLDIQGGASGQKKAPAVPPTGLTLGGGSMGTPPPQYNAQPDMSQQQYAGQQQQYTQPPAQQQYNQAPPQQYNTQPQDQQYGGGQPFNFASGGQVTPPVQQTPPAFTQPQQQYMPPPVQQQMPPQQQYAAQVPPVQQVNHPIAGASVIHLKKGEKFALTANNPGLRNLLVGLGWDIAQISGQTFDLDVSVFMTDANGVTQPERFVFYNNPVSPDGSVRHGGDNRTGQGVGDDEMISIDLALVPADVQKISFTVTIDEADVKHQNFGMVSNGYVRIVNQSTSAEICRYELGNFSVETGLVVAEMYRHGAEWKFNPIGSGFQGGLASICANYGLQTSD